MREIDTADAKCVRAYVEHVHVPIKIMEFTRKINLYKDMNVLGQLFFYLIRKQPDIVYTLTPKAGLLGMIASWLAFVPHRVHSVVGLPHLEATGKRRTILMMTERITYWFATNIYCNSFNLKKEIEGKMTKKPVNVIGNGSVNGVDTDLFNDTYSEDQKLKIRQHYAIAINEFVITFVGRIVKDKGINELIEVFSVLKVKYPALSLLLIGDLEDDLDPISSKSRELIANDLSIKQVGFKQDIRELLAITNLFVLPSYREGLPNVLIEAGSFGLPLVATDINGCNEIIIDGKNGLLVQKRDIKSLSDAIEKFIINPRFYTEIKNQVRKSIVDRYAQKFFFSKLREEFLHIEKSNK